ncbi:MULTISPECIES: hypothetical protein [unclassified Nocardioides]|uniref:hypothetical protein n=1 Tax=unclassified Nocardioides TaxID=2615069 RepID=UPI0026656BEC|nr:hypothetical protein [Nocardioides sp. Arc9.136]WKN47082.1 hypothetical protein OSR43_13650 [Nocardioides sp. Arc9.136]
MTERRLVLVRITAAEMPTAGAATAFELPDSVLTMLDEGWSVLSHTTGFPDLSGDMVVSLYCEKAPAA